MFGLRPILHFYSRNSFTIKLSQIILLQLSLHDDRRDALRSQVAVEWKRFSLRPLKVRWIFQSTSHGEWERQSIFGHDGNFTTTTSVSDWLWLPSSLPVVVWYGVLPVSQYQFNGETAVSLSSADSVFEHLSSETKNIEIFYLPIIKTFRIPLLSLSNHFSTQQLSRRDHLIAVSLTRSREVWDLLWVWNQQLARDYVLPLHTVTSTVESLDRRLFCA